MLISLFKYRRWSSHVSNICAAFSQAFLREESLFLAETEGFPSASGSSPTPGCRIPGTLSTISGVVFLVPYFHPVNYERAEYIYGLRGSASLPNTHSSRILRTSTSFRSRRNWRTGWSRWIALFIGNATKLIIHWQWQLSVTRESYSRPVETKHACICFLSEFSSMSLCESAASLSTLSRRDIWNDSCKKRHLLELSLQ